VRIEIIRVLVYNPLTWPRQRRPPYPLDAIKPPLCPFSFRSRAFASILSSRPSQIPQPCRWSRECPPRSASSRPVPAYFKWLMQSHLVHTHTHTLCPSLSLSSLSFPLASSPSLGIAKLPRISELPPNYKCGLTTCATLTPCRIKASGKEFLKQLRIWHVPVISHDGHFQVH